MQPIALTTKRSRNKYGNGRGELMLVHLCMECEDVSINRIAADDDADALLEVFNASRALPSRTRHLLLGKEIVILAPDSLAVVQFQLFGSTSQVSELELA